MSIPVIGTAIVNGVHWLYRLVGSIDYPVDTFVVFNNNGRGQLTKQLDLLATTQHKYIKQIKICHLPANIGCAGAWNLIIKTNMISPYWVIVNHDISFTPGFLQKLDTLIHEPETGIVFGRNNSYDLFAIKDWVIQEYGLFDENTYPAYTEDMDYSMRFYQKPIKTSAVDLPYYHGDTTEYAISGSQTTKVDSSLYDIILNNTYMNCHYIGNKWGVDPDQAMRCENPKGYIVPYNNSSISVSNLGSYDLYFNRKKHLGF